MVYLYSQLRAYALPYVWSDSYLLGTNDNRDGYAVIVGIYVR